MSEDSQAWSTEKPDLVIVGRPNVGKSTLFNRITKSRRSIVGDQPGITRDRIKLAGEWRDRKFLVTDTGGMTFGLEEMFPTLINEQVEIAVEDAGHVIFVVDGRTELTKDDRELAAFLQRAGRPVTVAVNKCDTETREDLADQFHELGLGTPFPISAEHGRNIDDLLEAACGQFPVSTEPDRDPERHIRVAIIGRPNAGKSTLLNRLTGADHAMVSPVAGTTRDAVDATIERDGVEFEFVDTAGIRRKGKTTEMTEKLSVIMAQRHLRMADVALMVIDAETGLTAIDATISGYAHQAGKAVILVVNKWDAVSDVQQADFRRDVRDHLKFLDYAPIAIVSALQGDKTDSLFPLVRKVQRESRKRVATGELMRFILEKADLDRATIKGFRKPRISYVTQVRTAPPTFIFFINRDEKFHFSFERFLINRLREEYGFEGSPIVIMTRLKRRKGA